MNENSLLRQSCFLILTFYGCICLLECSLHILMVQNSKSSKRDTVKILPLILVPGLVLPMPPGNQGSQ